MFLTIAASAVVALLAAAIIQYISCSNLLISKLGLCNLPSILFSAKEDEIPLSVLWMAPFFSPSGYGSEALSYVEALVNRGTNPPRLKIIHHGDSENHRYWSGLPHTTKQLLLRLNRAKLDLSSTIIICHSEPGAWFPPLYHTTPCPPTGYEQPSFVIGRTMFETDRLTPEHVRRCNAMDEVWVPSEFNMRTFENSGVDRSKLVKVPQAVDVHFFNPVKVTRLELPTSGRVLGPETGAEFISPDHYVFLSVFKWETRKGWDVLLKAYLGEFSADDQVVLYLVTSSYHSDGDFESRIMSFIQQQGLSEPVAGWPGVYVHDSHVPQTDLPRLYKAADAFVLPSRGEGWGRPHVEAMAMGLPVLATNWSGSTEFMRESNSYGLEVQGLSEIEEGAFKGHLWAEPSVTDLKRLMRHVFTRPDEAKGKGAKARQDMVAEFSPETISRSILWQLLRVSGRNT